MISGAVIPARIVASAISPQKLPQFFPRQRFVRSIRQLHCENMTGSAHHPICAPATWSGFGEEPSLAPETPFSDILTWKMRFDVYPSKSGPNVSCLTVLTWKGNSIQTVLSGNVIFTRDKFSPKFWTATLIRMNPNNGTVVTLTLDTGTKGFQIWAGFLEQHFQVKTYKRPGTMRPQICTTFHKQLRFKNNWLQKDMPTQPLDTWSPRRAESIQAVANCNSSDWGFKARFPIYM